MAGVGDVLEIGAETVSAFRSSIGRLRPGMIFESYSLAKATKYVKGVTSLFEAHHILPKSWASKLGLNPDGPAVLLTRKMHQPFTTELNRVLKLVAKYPKNLRRELAWGELQRIYAHKPDWLDAIAPMFHK